MVCELNALLYSSNQMPVYVHVISVIILSDIKLAF